MNLNDLVSLISSLGFPIVCCIAMFYQVNKQTDLHHAEVENLKDAINNNTFVLTRLVDKLTGEE